MKFYIKTYGCAMNYADSREIRSILLDNGYEQVSKDKDADLIILNSCSIRQQAEDKIIGWNIKTKKKSLKDKIIILTGCMAVRYDRGDSSPRTISTYSRSLANRFDWLDAIVDIRDIENLPQIIKNLTDINKHSKTESSTKKPDPYKFQGLIPISTGCDNFCSYCIVPYTRGPLKSFPKKKVLDQVKNSLNTDSKIITLLGQNVNNWNNTENPNKNSFTALLKEVSLIEGDFWINFLSSNPQDWSSELTDLIIKEKKIMKWLNLALQSGSDKILRKMNRKYSLNEFRQIVEKIRTALPKFRLTTDIIVGFPGESDNDFQKTIDIVKEIEFDMLYIGKYSPRKGTLSAKNYEDNIPFKIKKERENILKEILREISLKRNSEFVKRNIKILPLNLNRGISYYNHEVTFTNPIKSHPGKFITGTVVKANSNGLIIKA